jgi:hypothetical protein
MTISSTSNKVQFNGSGTTGPFPFTFKTFANGDLTVIKTDSLGVETTLVLTTDYTVSLNADQNNNPGGSVTTVATVASGYKLTLVREVDALQETDITNGGGFYPEVVENALDRLTMLVQQVDEKAERAVKVDVSSSTDPGTFLDGILTEAQGYATAASASASSASSSASNAAASYDAFDDRYLGSKASDPTVDNDGNALITGALYWSTTLNAMRVYSGSSWADVALGVSMPYQAFSGTGAQTAFTLSGTPGSLGSLEVFISGVRQVPGTNYTVSGTTLTFVVAPPSGTNNIFVRWVTTQAINVPADGSVTTAKIVDGAVTDAKLATTTFAKTDATNNFTVPQRSALLPDNDANFDLSAKQNFSCTPTGSATLTFTNQADGLSGSIIFVNGSNYAISAHANTKILATDLTKISTTGTYRIDYLSNGTNAYCSVVGPY